MVGLATTIGNDMTHNLTKEMVEAILRDHHKHEWSIQGLGMLRTYLSASLRLHVWNEEARVEGASTMHTHPWDFTSHVVVGCMADAIYREGSDGQNSSRYMRQTIKCGIGGGAVGDAVEVDLEHCGVMHIAAGHSYSRRAEEIHSSAFDNGTVTLVSRHFREDTERAQVYWKGPAGWGSAEPRRATLEEVSGIVGFTLNKYFGD